LSLIFLVAEAGECPRENRDDDAMLGPSLGDRQMSNGGDMFDPHCLLGRLFYVLLVGLMALPSSQAQSPGTTTINEGLFGNRSGTEKKDAALSFVEAALSMTDAITNRQIVDEPKFKEGLSKLIDGTVECLNASIWAKTQ
jgi:hypothetical protein